MKAEGTIELLALTARISWLLITFPAKQSSILDLLRSHRIYCSNFIHDETTLSFPPELTVRKAKLLKAELEMLFIEPQNPQTILAEIPLPKTWK